jgi:hypothetical protein
MMEILRFAFQDGWHFVGVWVLIAVTGDSIADIVKALRKPEQ